MATEKTYELSFVGVPLPEQYQGKFEEFSDTTAYFAPGIDLVYPHVEGHVTSNYLSTISEGDLMRVGAVLTRNKRLLRRGTISVGHVGVFDPLSPRLVYLHTQAPRSWWQFCQSVNEEIGNLNNVHLSNLARKPHLSVGKLLTPASKHWFTHHFWNIYKEKDDLWQFPITELVVFGVDPEVGTQQRLVEVPPLTRWV
jgi:hypothetical protein